MMIEKYDSIEMLKFIIKRQIDRGKVRIYIPLRLIEKLLEILEEIHD